MVDLEGLRESLREAGAEEVFPAVIHAFRSDAPDRLTAIEEAITRGDAEEVRKAAHAYKSAAGTIRAEALTDLLRQMEVAAAEGEEQTSNEMLEAIRIEHRNVLQILEQVGEPSDASDR